MQTFESIAGEDGGESAVTLGDDAECDRLDGTSQPARTVAPGAPKWVAAVSMLS